jgi:hypothetical protein
MYEKNITKRIQNRKEEGHKNIWHKDTEAAMSKTDFTWGSWSDSLW